MLPLSGGNSTARRVIVMKRSLFILLLLTLLPPSYAFEPIRYLTRGYVYDAAFSPDGRYIILALSDGIDLIDLQTLKFSSKPVKGIEVGELQVSPSGIVAGKVYSGNGLIIRIWKMEDDRLEKLFETKIHIGTFAISPDGEKVAISSDDRIWIWDKVRGKMAELTDRRDPAIPTIIRKTATSETRWGPGSPRTNDMVFSTDGRYLAVASSRRAVEVWDLETGRIAVKLDKKGEDDWQDHVAFSPDGRLMAALTFADKQLNVWDVQTGDRLLTLMTSSQDLSFMPDGNLLLVPDRREKLMLLDPITGRILDEMEIPHMVDKMRFSPRGDIFIALGGCPEIWSLKDKRLIGRLEEYNPGYGELTPDGRYIVSILGYTFSVRDTQTGEVKYHLFPEGPFFSEGTLSPDGRLAVVSDWMNLNVIDVGQGRIIRKIPYPEWPHCMAISPDDRELILDDFHMIISLDVMRAKGLSDGKRFEVESSIKDMKLSDDGRLLVLGGYEGNIEVWERVKQGDYKRILFKKKAHPGMDMLIVNSYLGIIATAQRGSYTGKPDTPVRIWSLKDLSLIKEIKGYAPIAFTPEGDRLFLMNGNKLEIWNWARERKIFELPCQYFLLSGDGNTLITIDDKDRMAVWDARKLKNLPPVMLAQVKTGELFQNFPNPFNPDTWIPFKLHRRARVVIGIYDLSGHLVRELDLGIRDPGDYTSKGHAAHWDGRNDYGEAVSSGIYLYRFLQPRSASFRKMVVIR